MRSLRSTSQTLYGEIDFCKGIRRAKYLSSGMIKLCVSSRKCRRIKADCTWLGRRVWVPLAMSFNSALSRVKWDLYDVYTPGLHSDNLLDPGRLDLVARIFNPALPKRNMKPIRVKLG
jgi:hypothetical protein